jgi:hypothetical protein
MSCSKFSQSITMLQNTSCGKKCPGKIGCQRLLSITHILARDSEAVWPPYCPPVRVEHLWHWDPDLVLMKIGYLVEPEDTLRVQVQCSLQFTENVARFRLNPYPPFFFFFLQRSHLDQVKMLIYYSGSFAKVPSRSNDLNCCCLLFRYVDFLSTQFK